PMPLLIWAQYSSGEPSNFGYTPQAWPTTPIPQYTQSQINTYYQQYQCYPPQPYNIIPEYYAQPLATPVAHIHSTGSITPEGGSRSNSRTRTWTCDVPNCTSTANFTRLADLQRHQSTVHGMGTPDFPCTVPRCTRVGDKGFTRRDHLVEHLRNFHHLDIPKRRPGERSANPLGLPQYQ
ncbi:hypothetical protein K491DRAFT_600854, partial [Lophiostoma macrostomum CBS 122681]